jgi:hypothetical protein
VTHVVTHHNGVTQGVLSALVSLHRLYRTKYPLRKGGSSLLHCCHTVVTPRRAHAGEDGDVLRDLPRDLPVSLSVKKFRLSKRVKQVQAVKKAKAMMVELDVIEKYISAGDFCSLEVDCVSEDERGGMTTDSGALKQEPITPLMLSGSPPGLNQETPPMLVRIIPDDVRRYDNVMERWKAERLTSIANKAIAWKARTALHDDEERQRINQIKKPSLEVSFESSRTPTSRSSSLSLSLPMERSSLRKLREERSRHPSRSRPSSGHAGAAQHSLDALREERSRQLSRSRPSSGNAVVAKLSLDALELSPWSRLSSGRVRATESAPSTTQWPETGTAHVYESECECAGVLHSIG